MAAESAPPAATRKATAKPQASQESKRYFEYTDDKSSKFWEISIAGTSVTVRYGKIGVTGQTQTKTFPDAAGAQKHHDKLIEEKTEKGYEEQDAE